jgi:hypothetical protein
MRAAPPIALPAAAPAGDRLGLTRPAPGQLVLRAQTGAGALLVLGEVFYPGWQATVDGRPAALLSADGILLALALPAGDHQVELTFAPDLFTIGAVVSALSAALWLGALALLRRT